MSRSPDVKYHRLSQLAVSSDDEDEGFGDNILFDSRLVNGTTTDNRNIFEMEELGLPRVRSSPEYYGNFTKRRRWCVAIAIICLLTVATGCGVMIPMLTSSTASSTDPQEISPQFESARDWNLTFNDAWTESSVYLIDLDKDRLDDILIGLADQTTIEGVLGRSQNITMKQYCKSKGVNYPCGATVTAFRGLDGKQIWQTNTRSVVIHQICVDLKISGNMKTCILTGRHATCMAVEAFTGHHVWMLEDPDSAFATDHFIPQWSVYQPVVLPDLDGDGVLDLLVSHGGDKDKEPWDHDRKAGRLILLSGLKGSPIGAFLELPDNKETYMPPVRYETPTGAIYILIGTGGETVQGSLLAISLPDIYHHATGHVWSDEESNARYDWLDSKQLDQTGFAVLFSGKTKGVMVPPVVLAAKVDEWSDMLVTTFDGQVGLIDGKSLDVVWTRTFDEMETYSSPSPGFFNDDSTLDWLVHFNHGTWDKYNDSKTLILNGMDGKTMWSHQAHSYAYSSDLSLQIEGEGKNSHAFIAKMAGLNSSVTESVQAGLGLMKRHLGHQQEMENFQSATNGNMSADEFQLMCHSVAADMKHKLATCEQNLDSLTQDVLLFDFTLRDHPLRIYQQKAERIPYQLSHRPGDFHCHDLSEQHKINMCLVLMPTSYTGALGDVDGDDHVDYVHVTQMMGTRRSDTYDPLESVSKVILSKRNLHLALSRKEFVHLDKSIHDNDKKNNNDDIINNDSDGISDGPIVNTDGKDGSLSLLDTLRNHVDSIVFQRSQAWCQYLGCRGDSWYHIPPP